MHDQYLADQPVECPYCGERIVLLVDLSAGGQHYIEDCSVCCRPIEVVQDDSGRLEVYRDDQ